MAPDWIWALFYGSVPVLLVAVAAWAAANFLKVPQEERGLEARFGGAYRAYKARVPRWLSLPRRRGGAGDRPR